MITRVKTNLEIEAMRAGGKILASVLATVSQSAVAGISTKELSDIAANEIKALGAKPAFLGYQGFPEVLCVSINDEVVHGIPKSGRIVQAGDIVSLDLGLTYKGMIVDSALSVLVESADSEKAALLQTTERALMSGISAVQHNCATGDIAAAVQKVLDKGRYGIVRDLVGHGVGHAVHEDPNIPNYGKAGMGFRLQAGMTVAIEPMATLGKYEVSIGGDGWTVKTVDHSLAAHFEHTVLVTESGYEILTAL